MAAVLDALAPYVKKMITDMAQDEVSMLMGASGEITKLEDNMESIKAFLADAERRRLTDQSVQRWVRKLKDALYDATDIMDLCKLEADKWKESKLGGGVEKAPAGCCQSLILCFRNPVFAHKIGSRIKELNQRVDAICKAAHAFSFSNLGSYTERRMLTDAELSSYKTRSQVDESAIVGKQIERDTRELIQVLTTDDNRDSIKVVSVTGTGGMGKTTLAQKIFNDAAIQGHFKTKIWLSINQHFDEAELLRTAIENAGQDHGGKNDKSTLTDTLISTLSSTGRFLLVMDDVWSEKAWNNVLSDPVRMASKKQPGSRVLVTTRSAHLPEQMQAPLHQLRVTPLGEDDAWSLLKKQLQTDQVVGIEQLKNIGMKILERCDGLPLAIKVVGGLLSTRYPSEAEWKSVLDRPTWSVAGLPQDLDSRIYLSYEDLSPQVKQCFLYCSLFPKGEEIIQRGVTHMWIGEGFIQPPDKSSSSCSYEYDLEDIAIEYYRELIKRNLIEPTKKYSITGYRCTMHDVVHSFAEYMAREESIVAVEDKQIANCGGAAGGKFALRRLSIGPTVSVAEWAVLQMQKSLRTLIINCGVNFKHGDSLGSLSSLRVLYIWSADSDRLAPYLSKLKHLRYLHLESADISRLPDDIHKMKFLVCIKLLRCVKLACLPNSITKLVHLRFLDISGSSVRVVPKGFGGLINLRSLFGFPVHVDSKDDAGNSSSWCSLQELGPLSQLRRLQLDGVENVTASWMAEKAMISSKAHLRYLDLTYYNNSGATGSTSGPSGDGGDETEAKEEQQQQHLQQSVIEAEEVVLEKLCPPTCLESLLVTGGYLGRQLPNWMHASTDFKSLRFLTLENLPHCTQLPDGLCCLPCLELLTIKDAPAVKRVGPQFQALLVAAATSAPPFPKLRELNLLGLCEWEEWEWNDDQDSCEAEHAQRGVSVIAMPCLETLKIKNCKLSCLPPGLANSKRLALRELNLYQLTKLEYVDKFPSIVELDVFDCPELKRISGLSRLHKIRIVRCPNLEVLEGVLSLDTLQLWDATMEALPGYLRAVNPRYLDLDCSTKLYESLSPGTSEWNKISHIGKRNIGYINQDSDAES